MSLYLQYTFHQEQESQLTDVECHGFIDQAFMSVIFFIYITKPVIVSHIQSSAGTRGQGGAHSPQTDRSFTCPDWFG